VANGTCSKMERNSISKNKSKKKACKEKIMSGYDDADLKAAYMEGCRDYLKNVPKLDCPYDDLEMKEAWLDGWCDTKDDEDDK